MKRIVERFPNMNLDFFIEDPGDEAGPSHVGAASPIVGPGAKTSNLATAVLEPIPEPGVTKNAPTLPTALPPEVENL